MWYTPRPLMQSSRTMTLKLQPAMPTEIAAFSCHKVAEQLTLLRVLLSSNLLPHSCPAAAPLLLRGQCCYPVLATGLVPGPGAVQRS